MATQFAEEREEIVMDFLNKKGSIHIGDVTDLLRISPSTARLLLQKMQDKGMLRRTHGGAIPVRTKPAGNTEENSVENKDLPEPRLIKTDKALESPSDMLMNKIQFLFGQIDHLEEKLQIAATAVATVNDEDYISIGSGTTAWLMSTMLGEKKDLTVVTDSILIASELAQKDNIILYVCGGWVMPQNAACRGITAEAFFNDMKVDKAYNGADSINVEVGVTSSDYDPRTERAICHSGKECYILADASKFSTRPYMDKVLSLQEIDHIISDSSLPNKYADALRKNGVDVILSKG